MPDQSDQPDPRDVVEHGAEWPEEGPGGGLPPGVRRVALVLAVLAAALLLSRSGLLSGGGADEPRPVTRSAAPGTRLVAAEGDRLVRLTASGPTRLARLPGARLAAPGLVAVRTATPPGSVVGVRGGLLFRVGLTPGSEWVPIGRWDAVVAASPVPGRVLVRRGGSVAEVEAATGRVANAEPFPGAGTPGWLPEALVRITGTRVLLLSRPAAGGSGVELALAWPERRVASGANPDLQVLGTFGRLLGAADDRVLVSGESCPGPSCGVRAVTVTRDAVLVRDVVPPVGWTVAVDAPVVLTSEALVAVRRVGREDGVALARLVAGGDNALLVSGTAGADLDAGLVEALDGSVRLLVRSAVAPARVRIWRPDEPARATAAAVAAPARGGRLVCVCG